jgi:hypothetical protein
MASTPNPGLTWILSSKEHRVNEKLREKLILNGRRLKGLEQRNRLSALLPTISLNLRAVLCNAPTHFGEEEIRFDGIIPSPIGSIWVDKAPVLPSPNAEYRDTDCWQSVLETIARFECQDCVPALLKFGDCLPSCEINLSHYVSIIGDLVSYLAQHRFTCFAWVSLDSNDGVVLSNYGGYLDIERRTNNDEIVFEIINWGRVRETTSTNKPIGIGARLPGRPSHTT